VAWVVDVLDDLFGLPGTVGAVGVLKGRQCAPGDALDRPHHPLESPAVADGAVVVPGDETARQDAPMVNLLKFVRVLVARPNLFSLLRCGLTISDCH
jgi:hypothetical protein